jgi:hypothetical protein
MSRDRNLTLGCGAVAIVALALVVRGTLGWPWLILILVTGVGAALAGRLWLVGSESTTTNRYDGAPSYPRPSDGDEHLQPNRVSLADVQLPSADPEYRFGFSATVCWRPAYRPTGPHNLAAVAQHAIIQRAAATTATEQPGSPPSVTPRLAAALGSAVMEKSGQVHVWAEDVRVAMAERDLLRLQRISDARKDERLWELERSRETNRRHYLTDDVLRTPGSAVVWQLAQDPSKVRETVALIGALSRLSAAANGVDVPELYLDLAGEAPSTTAEPIPVPQQAQHPIGSPSVAYIRSLFPPEENDVRMLFGDNLRELLTKFQIHHEADNIRSTFDTADYADSEG